MNPAAIDLTNPLGSLYCALFEVLGLDVLQVHADQDCFFIKIELQNQMKAARHHLDTELLLFNSLEMFSNWLSPSIGGFHPSSSYFINLHPKPLLSTTFLIEIDHLTTSSEVIYLEAYCYDEWTRLIGKAGRMLLKA